MLVGQAFRQLPLIGQHLGKIKAPLIEILKESKRCQIVLGFEHHIAFVCEPEVVVGHKLVVDARNFAGTPVIAGWKHPSKCAQPQFVVGTRVYDKRHALFFDKFLSQIMNKLPVGER